MCATSIFESKGIDSDLALLIVIFFYRILPLLFALIEDALSEKQKLNATAMKRLLTVKLYQSLRVLNKKFLSFENERTLRQSDFQAHCLLLEINWLIFQILTS